VGSERESDEVPDWRVFQNFDLAGDVGDSVGPTWQIYVFSKGLPKLVNSSGGAVFPVPSHEPWFSRNSLIL